MTERTSTSRLRELIRGTAAAVPAAAWERCDLCESAVSEEHGHLFNLEEGTLLCACRPCSLLFDHSAAGGTKFRLVPDRIRSLEPFVLDDLGWRALRIPVEMAYFVRRGDGGPVTAYYPSPAGPIQSLLAFDAWPALEAANPLLRDLANDVEALLVNRVGGARDAWIVGIDTCYRLAGVVRTRWEGMQGGDAFWSEIERFFDDLRSRAAKGR